MFGTIIVDKYKKSEAQEIADAINDLCNPSDSYGWASAGIYSFWNYYSKEILYIGLAVDLTERFKQHNGLIPAPDTGCKKKQIDEYFEKFETLGYTIFVQSPISQPVTNKNAKNYMKIDIEEYGFTDLRSDPARDMFKKVEGILIETYKMKHGELPPWNKIGGSADGQRSATIGNYDIIRCFSFDLDLPLVARYTIRELSANSTFEWYENFMHGARIVLLSWGKNFKEALKFIRERDVTNTYERMVKDGYFKKKLNI